MRNIYTILLTSHKAKDYLRDVCVGTVGSFVQAKLQDREPDHSSPSSVEVKNDGVVPPPLQIFLQCSKSK
jgi:hypothetical protein